MADREREVVREERVVGDARGPGFNPVAIVVGVVLVILLLVLFLGVFRGGGGDTGNTGDSPAVEIDNDTGGGGSDTGGGGSDTGDGTGAGIDGGAGGDPRIYP